jgi:hypothetical protein
MQQVLTVVYIIKAEIVHREMKQTMETMMEVTVLDE